MPERLIGPGTFIRNGVCAVGVTIGGLLMADGLSEGRNHQQQVDANNLRIQTIIDQELPKSTIDAAEERQKINEIKAQINAAIEAAKPELAMATLAQNAQNIVETSSKIQAHNQQESKRWEERLRLQAESGLPFFSTQKGLEKALLGGFTTGLSLAAGVLWPLSGLIIRFDQREIKPKSPTKESNNS